jgi:hypothetical protein
MIDEILKEIDEKTDKMDMETEKKKFEEHYKKALQKFLDTHEDGGFLSGMLLGLIAEIVIRTIVDVREHMDENGHLSHDKIVEFIATNNLDLLNNLVDVGKYYKNKNKGK